VPLTLEQKVFQFSDSARLRVRRRLNLNDSADKQAPIFIYVGRFGYKKGLAAAMRALESVSRETGETVHLIICGNKTKFEYKHVRSLINRFENHPTVRLFNFEEVPRARVAELMSGADFFLSPSWYPYESFGLATLEALASGLPCILTEWQGLRDFKKVGHPSIWIRFKKQELQSKTVLQKGLEARLKKILRRLVQHPELYSRTEDERKRQIVPYQFTEAGQAQALDALVQKQNWSTFTGFKYAK
jgi:glycosyltransferase involved in cell wall biosynthesis